MVVEEASREAVNCNTPDFVGRVSIRWEIDSLFAFGVDGILCLHCIDGVGGNSSCLLLIEPCIASEMSGR